MLLSMKKGIMEVENKDTVSLIPRFSLTTEI